MYWAEDPKELKKRRTALGFTQKELAEKARVPLWLVKNVEKGRRRFTPEVRNKLWTALAELDIERREAAPLANLSDLLLPAKALIPRMEVWSKEAGLTADSASARLKEQNRVLTELVAVQKTLLAIQGELLKATSIEKDAEILKLEQKIADLRELYNVGTQAVAASARYEELLDKVMSDTEKK